MFYITLPSDTFNLHIHTHLGTDTKLHIYTILKTIEKQKSIVNIKTSHNDKNSISTNTLKAITHKNTNLNIKTAIVIKENADKVIANTCCKALTLSNDSEITVKPFLKILNNDVVCTHGASIGLIDRNMLQYMQSRGIKIEKAKLLIANGFIKDILNKISDMKVKTYTNTIN
jgi:Fe-S cluster assembly protein SufD